MDGLSQALHFREQLEAALEGVVYAPEFGEVLHGALPKLALASTETQQVPLVDVSAFSLFVRVRGERVIFQNL